MRQVKNTKKLFKLQEMSSSKNISKELLLEIIKSVWEDLDDSKRNQLSVLVKNTNSQNFDKESMIVKLAKLGIDVEQVKKKLNRERAERKNANMSDKIGRNEQCPCESGKKYKKCCFLRTNRKTEKPVNENSGQDVVTNVSEETTKETVQDLTETL